MAKSKSSTPRKRGAGKAVPEAQMLPDDIEMNVIIDDPQALIPRIDPVSGAMEIPHDDGSIIIDFAPEDTNPEIDGSKHDANLAMKLPDYVMSTIAEQILEGIAADDQSRAEWLNMRAKGLELLGLKNEDPKSGVGASSAPLEGMSVYRDPLLKEAVLRFQANFQGEMLPASGPVKVVDFGDQPGGSQLADDLEDDLNYYLTTTASEYYPDTRRMAFEAGFSGVAFKKVYMHPLRRRPVSESVSAEDLIVSDNVTDLRNAIRITHRIEMRRSDMKRMQILGVYRDVELDIYAQPENKPVADKAKQLSGLQPHAERPIDTPYTVYECYCDLDIPGYEHKVDGKVSGLAIPYRVTIEKDSRKVLEIHRNWDEDDEDCQAKIPFVDYTYATGMGFYGIGLLSILGNSVSALTAIVREGIDAGMFANFPGFLFAKEGARQMTNEFRIPPGGGLPIETGGRDIRQIVMGLPYKEMGPATMTLAKDIRDVGQRVGGTADTPVGEGKQDAPVGTTLAMIEQATKVEGAVLKSMHASQAREFQLLCELFKDDPEALWRGNRRPKMGAIQASADEQAREAAKKARLERFKLALDSCDIVPKADPNVPSRMQRLMTAQAVKQIAMTAPPGMYDMRKVDEHLFQVLNVENPESFFAPPAAPNTTPPPEVLLKAKELEIKNKDVDVKAAKVKIDAVEHAKDREVEQNIEVLKMVTSLAVHPESNETVDTQLEQMAPMLSAKPKLPPLQPSPQPMMPPRPVPAGLGGLGRPMSFAPPPQRRAIPPMMPGGMR